MNFFFLDSTRKWSNKYPMLLVGETNTRI